MHVNKKAITSFIITVLTLSAILAALPMATVAITSAPGLFVPATTPVTPLTTGPVGTKVNVVGAAGDASPFSTVTIYWGDLTGPVLGTVAADSTGAYSVNVTIPSATNGAHFIVANDGAGAMGSSFTVTASLRAMTAPGPPPVRALPGDAVALTGHGYAPNSAVTVTLDSTTLATPVSITLTTPTITTNGTGSFEATITIPGSITVAQYDVYTVTATDAVANSATASVTIDYYMTVSPPSGPTGITITMRGRIPATTAYELRIDATTIATGTSGADGSFTNTYVIPALISLGGHTVSVVWATVNVRSTTFTVTASPQITYTPTAGVAGTVVTISTVALFPFTANANISLYLGPTLVNSTAVDDRFGPTVAAGPAAGSFTDLEFTVPALAPGVYVLTVVDENGATTGTTYTFTVTPTPVTTIALRGTVYYPCCTLSFNIFTTDGFTAGPVVTIRDPTGAIWWTATWPLTASGPSWSVLYQDQLVNGNPIKIPLDAPLGTTWNWTVTYTPVSTGVSTTVTGLFEVAAEAGMQAVLDRLDDLQDDLEAEITSVVTTSQGTILARINTKSGEIMADIAVLEPKLQGIEDTAVIIATMLGEVQVAIEDIDLGTALAADITSIKNGVATIQTSIGTVTSSVSALDAKVTSLSGDVATVSTTVGTIEGTVTSIEGDIATVDTEVGAIQADVSEILAKPDVDMTPAWIAAILALIAAIAAVFAVITIRMKIAG